MRARKAEERRKSVRARGGVGGATTPRTAGLSGAAREPSSVPNVRLGSTRESGDGRVSGSLKKDCCDSSSPAPGNGRRQWSRASSGRLNNDGTSCTTSMWLLW